MKNISAQSRWNRLPLVEVFRRIIKFFGWRLFGGLVLAICSLGFFAWLADEVFEGGTKVFDENVRDYVHGFASPALTAAMKFFSFAGSPLVLTIFGIIIVTIFILQKHKRAVVLFLIAMAGELILDLSLKTFFQRTRPEPFFGYVLPSSYSFPSGHALGSFCFFGTLAWLVTARIENTPLKIIIWITAIFLIAAIGISRIYLGVHYPSDVIAGYTTGIFWVLTVALGDFWMRQKKV